MTRFEIRPADILDYKQIAAIKKSNALDIGRLADTKYKVAIEQQGFLLPYELTKADFTHDLAAYSVCEHNEDKKIVGFYSLHDNQSMRGRHAVWFGPEERAVQHQNAYYGLPHAYLHTIGVSPEVNHHGAGSAMLEHLEGRLRERNIPWLFSMIVMQPVTNVASMLFHDKAGFERMALVEPEVVLGMHGFQNLLYGKQLNAVA